MNHSVNSILNEPNCIFLISMQLFSRPQEIIIMRKKKKKKKLKENCMFTLCLSMPCHFGMFHSKSMSVCVLQRFDSD